jgi:hypothetical protein
MKFAEIRDRIANNPGFKTLEEVKQAGYQIVKERDGDRYFLAKPKELHPLLVRLGDIAEVRRGFTTGANEFFYLEPIGMTVKEVAELAEEDPMAPVRVKNSAGWEGEIEAGWLRPVIKSPREIKTLKVRLEDLRYLVFMPPDDVRSRIKRGIQNLLRGYPKAAAYIRWGEDQGYPSRPTCASRERWWYLGEREMASFVWPMIHNDRFLVITYDAHIVVDHNLFEIRSQSGSTLTGLMAAVYEIVIRELIGRSNLGQGALKTEGVDIVRLYAINPSVLPIEYQQLLLSTYERLARHPIRNIFEELGFELCHQRRCSHPEHPYERVKPEALTLEQVRQASPDRYELDSVVFDVLGLTEEERLEVYRAVVQLVKERLLKARSV